MMCEHSPYERFVVELVGIFDALDDSERTRGHDGVPLGGWGSRREGSENDLKELTLDELINQLAQTDDLLEAFSYIAESTNNVAALTMLGDAWTRTRTALRRTREFKERAQA